MPDIIKDGVIQPDYWVVITDTTIDKVTQLPEGKVILPLMVWRTLKNDLQQRGDLGVWINSLESVAEIKDDCHNLPVIAINFPIFSDGRGYSMAHILRQQYNYTGELRAMGDVLRDQLFFMKRCGFNSFAMRADQKIDEALKHFSDFNYTYQAAVDKPTPLFADR